MGKGDKKKEADLRESSVDRCGRVKGRMITQTSHVGREKGRKGLTLNPSLRMNPA
jgi:hypothetical protein